MAITLELFGMRIAFSCLTLILKIAMKISVKLVVLLKVETLNKLQECVKDTYYVGLKHEKRYFQIQFINMLKK